jgi:hypothetical protein
VGGGTPPVSSLPSIDLSLDPASAFKFELYDVTKDWAQNDDLAAANPGKVQEMRELMFAEFAKYQVLPRGYSSPWCHSTLATTRRARVQPNSSAHPCKSWQNRGKRRRCDTVPKSGAPRGPYPRARARGVGVSDQL